jgi:hypothetical protein
MDQLEWVILLIEVGVIALVFLLQFLGVGRRVP